ncbi:MAG: DNA alkylation repair protein [Firmicutes bacterium]|nr:DNA alkylation repair protein [Bacillota bacterium]
MTLQQIKEIFEKHANIELGLRDTKYMRNLFPHYGVRASDRDKLFKPLFDAKDNPIDWGLVQGLWDEPMREMQYIAVWYLWCKRAQLTKADLTTLRKFAQVKSWWDTIDGLCVTVGNIVSRDESTKQIMLDWSTDENYWIRRIALQHQLYFKAKTDTELLSQIIKNNFGEKERSNPSADGKNQEQNRAFFINKSIGWVLREFAKTNPDWVRNFVLENKDSMAKLSIREATKHLK